MTLLALGASAEIGDWNGDTSDSKRSFEQICQENGFEFEMHEVTTADGYMLNVFRIPGQLGETPVTGAKPPVLL